MLNDQAISMKNKLADTVNNFKGEVQETMNRQQEGSNQELVSSIVQGLKKEAGVMSMLRPHGGASGTQDADGQPRPAGFLKNTIKHRIMGDGADVADLAVKDDQNGIRKGRADPTTPSASTDPDSGKKGGIFGLFSAQTERSDLNDVAF